MIRAGHVACGGFAERCTGVLWGNLTDGNHWQHLDVVWEDDIKIDLQEM